jgi:hypothetical protein
MIGSTRAERAQFYGAEAWRMNRDFGIPYFIARGIVTIYRKLKHVVNYCLFPLLVGTTLFIGKSSAYLKIGEPGLRGADYYIVFSERERKICIEEENIDKKKLVVIPHPLRRMQFDDIRAVFEGGKAKEENIITIFSEAVNVDFCIDKRSGKRVPGTAILQNLERLVESLSRRYHDYSIYIKLHPAQKNDFGFIGFTKRLAQKYRNVRIASPEENAIEYIKKSKIIIGGVTTVLFLADLLYPSKKIVSVNFNHSLIGNCYENHPNIFYFNDMRKLENSNLDKSEIKRGYVETADYQHVTDFLEKIL